MTSKQHFLIWAGLALGYSILLIGVGICAGIGVALIHITSLKAEQWSSGPLRVVRVCEDEGLEFREVAK